jgi:5-methylcytosine-specific restriction enzyme A
MPDIRCPACARLGNTRCPACRVAQNRERWRTVDRERSNLEIRKLYRTARWRAYRDQKRAEDPLCVECRAEGLFVTWDDLDHVVPHHGDLELFWDYDNLRGLCHRHHSAKTRREQVGGVGQGSRGDRRGPQGASDSHAYGSGRTDLGFA